MVVAVDHAQFWMPEIFAGVMGDAGCFRLPRRIPRAIALEMLLTGRRMGAEEALGWGLVNAVVPPENLMDKARQYAELMVAAAPLALAASKETVRLTETCTMEECYAKMKSGGLPMFNKMLASHDAVEGPLAFAEKRDPVWTGK
jgi:crotonobetainyl-CoA hydratase